LVKGVRLAIGERVGSSVEQIENGDGRP